MPAAVPCCALNRVGLSRATILRGESLRGRGVPDVCTTSTSRVTVTLAAIGPARKASCIPYSGDGDGRIILVFAILRFPSSQASGQPGPSTWTALLAANHTVGMNL
jgi:hypothetical protein